MIEQRRRFDILQTYRAIAAFVVVLHHVNGKFSAPHYYGALIPDFFVWGQLGVDFFFVLSGFIIAMSLAKTKTASGFWLHRFARVYPPFWLAFFATLAVALAAASRLKTPVTEDPMSLLGAVLLLPQNPAPVISVAWTLHHEVLFYALAGLYLRFPRAACGCAAVLLGGSFFEHESFLPQFLFSSFHWEFLAGVAAFAWRERIPQRHALPLVLASALVVAGTCAWFGLHDLFWTPSRYFIEAPLFAMLVAASTRLSHDSSRAKGMTWATALGDSSYTLYLWHIALVTPMTKLVFAVLPQLGTLPVMVLLVAIACATCGVAHAIYIFIERPLVTAIRRRLEIAMKAPAPSASLD